MRRVPTLVVTLCLACAAAPAFAAWPHDPGANLALCTLPGSQSSPFVLPDGAGGAFVAWHGFNPHGIFIQRVNASGVPLWATNGVVICSAGGGGQVQPVMCSDGAGGVIVAWYDDRNIGQSDIYAQHVDQYGVPQWLANGIPIATGAANQQKVQIVSDGEFGAVMCWRDNRSGSWDIYVQRVTGGGFTYWTANGVALTTAANHQDEAVIAPDGTGGAIVCWSDQRAGAGVNDIYGQRVNSVGAPQWTANGIPICTLTGNQVVPRIVADGLGGAIVAWNDQRSADYNILAQHVTSAGTQLWALDGTFICAASNDQSQAVMASDGVGGAVIAWADSRNGFQDIYAQRINGAGNTLWPFNGVALCTSPFPQNNPSITSDGAQGAVIAWVDQRGFSWDVYAQRVSPNGTPLWTGDGVPVCTATWNQSAPFIAADGAGGAIAAWVDPRFGPGETDIYAQRVDRYGQLGNPEPAIVNVRDVPGDQGGKVRVAFDASYLDADPWNQVANYWIWRQAPPAAAIAAFARGARLEGQAPAADAGSEDLWKITQDATQTYYWEYVTSLPAQGFPGYSCVVTTTGDSIGTGNPRTFFMVEAKSSGTAHWESLPDSGYSVDNLRPATPAAFTGQYVSGNAFLHWNANVESDLAGYRLYRGTSPSFVPGPGNLIASPTETGYTDPAGTPYVYKLTAVDVHGNESPVTTFQVGGPTGVGDGPTLSFAMPRPNPAVTVSRMEYTLPHASTVRLAVHDLAGRLVREIARGIYAAGAHAEVWDLRDGNGGAVGGGLYFVRFEVDGQLVRACRVVVSR